MIIPEYSFAVREDLLNSDFVFLPTRADDKSSGWDVRCAHQDGLLIYPFEYALIPLGIRMIAPPGYWLELRPRSSTHAKKNLHALYGVIDESYEGEILFSCQYIPCSSKPQDPIFIEFGERIGQVIPIERQEMEVSIISNENFDLLCKRRGELRGGGGFGSSGS
jgi:deoxyuridine 5'-triphosphate nucleotidohydrolase